MAILSTPNIYPVILRHHIRPDGSVPVKIRITHKRKVKYLPTLEVAYKGDYTRDLTIKDMAMMKRLLDLVEKIQNAVAALDPWEVSSMDVGVLARRIEQKMDEQEVFRLDFFEFSLEVIAKKPRFTAANYKTAMSSFASFLGRTCMDISEITSSLLRSFEAYLVEKHGKEGRAVSQYTAALRHIHSEARKKYNDDETGVVKIRNPFEYYHPPKQKPAQKRGLEPETIQKLIDIRGTLGKYHKLAVDVFLLSFILMGTNVPDIHEARREGDLILYNRMKTRDRRHDNAEMRIRLEPVAECVYKDLLDPDGQRAFWLYKKYSFYGSIADKGNDRLKDVAKIIGVPSFTMYAARHTWASIAYSAGVPKSLINDCLCHVDPDMAVTDIYIKKDWSVLWEANKKVLELFKWK